MKTLSAANQIAVIDISVSDYQALQRAAEAAGMEIILLSDTGISGLAEQLQGRGNIDALHLFSHGSEGELLLAGDTLNSDTLEQHSESLQAIGVSLSDDADLLLYGCNVAAGDKGNAFLEQLASLTGADIAASDDLTGAETLNGDWELERSVGAIESRSLESFSFSSTLGSQYASGVDPLVAAGAQTANNGFTLVVPIDYDSDGDQDFIGYDGAAYKLYQNNGSGSFSQVNPSVTFPLVNAADYTVADVDNDGDLDFIAPDQSASTSKFYRNDGGTFSIQADPLAAAGAQTAGNGASLIAAIDYDSDGDQDFIGYDGSAFKLYQNNGSGTFSQQNPSVVFPLVNGPNYIVVDIDGDGDQDFIAPDAGADTSKLYRNDGGTFSVQADPVAAVGAQTAGNGTALITAIDYDSDGDQDFIGYDGAAYKVYLNNGSGSFTEVTPNVTFPLSNAENFNIVDIDNDGDKDILVANPSATTSSLFVQNGTVAGTNNRPPKLTASSPADDSTGVDPSANLTLTFDETISSAGTGVVRIYKASDDSLVESIAGNDAKITGVGGTTITINPSSTLSDNTEYYVLIASQAFYDADGMTFMGITDKTALSFTTGSSNAAPVLGGTPADDTATEDLATAIDLSAYNISDGDGDTVTLTLAVDRGTIASTDGNGTTAGVTVSNSGTASMTLQGSVANLNTYLDNTSKITYTTAANDTTTAVLTVTPNDGTANGTADTVNITISAVNDNPTGATLPASVTVTEDTQSNIDLSAASFADVDSASVSVTLTASAGTFATPADGAGVGGGVTETQVNATTITLVGAAADINTYLDTASNIQYTSASNVSGNAAATITVTANDGDGSGNVNLGTVNLNVTAVNDNPTIATLPASVTVTEDTQSNIDLSAATFGDVDSASITVTLTASAGTFATPADGAGVGGGVTETLQSPTVITLVGAPADISTYLDTASNIQYTGATNASGNAAATITVTGNDGDGSGNVALGTVNINITGVNDNPTVASLPASITVTEDTQSNVALGAASFGDVDGDNVTLTLTASAGTFATPADGAGVGGGVTETLINSTTITLVGAAADINTYLDTASNIQYTPLSNVSGNAAATITVTANDGAGSGNVNMGTVNLNVTAVNDAPAFSGLDGTPAFTEGGAAQILDANVSVADVELGSLNGGNGDFNGATLVLARNGGVNSSDLFSIQSGGNLAVAGSNISAGGNIFATFDNGSVAGQVTISFISANGTTPTTALVNEVMQAVEYANSSSDPAASVQIDWTFSDGNSGNAQGTGPNPGTGTGSTTVSVTNVNDAPTLTATGGNPTFTEDGAAQDLFNTVSASTVEAADRFTTLQLTVTNVSDGGAEVLSLDGSDIALTNGNAVTTATNSLLASVSVVGTTATVSFTGASLTSAQMQTLVDALTYRNTSDTPTTAGNRVVTVTGIADNGGTLNGGVATAAPNLTSTVTVAAVNDAPTLTGFGPDAGNVGYIGGSTTFVAFDSGTTANLQDVELDALNGGAGNYNGATVTLVRNGGANVEDRFGLAGGTTALDNGSTVTVGGTHIGTVTSGSAASGSISITFNSSATSALVDTFFQSIGYTNANGAATGTVTIDVTLNDGNSGSQGSGGAKSVTEQVSVAIGNPPVIGNLNGDSVAFTEDAGAVLIDQNGDATVTDADTPANLNGGNLSVSVTGNANAAQDLLSFSTAGAVSLSSNTAGSNVSVSGTVIGTLANNIAAGNTLQVNLNSNATTANVQTLVQAATYTNISQEPATASRTLTFVVTDDIGLSSTAVTTTVTVNAVNDQPTVSATGDNSIYLEGSGSVSVFSAAAVDTIETTESIESVIFTVTNVAGDGSDERITLDGSEIALSHNNSGTTASNSFAYAVALNAGTATVTVTRTDTAANYETLIDGLSYRNTAPGMDTNNRVFTITTLKDSGGTANGGDDTAENLTVSSTLTLQLVPKISTATYDASIGSLVVTGSGIAANGGGQRY